MEKLEWEKVWLANEAIESAEKYELANSAIPEDITSQFTDNLETVDNAHNELLPLLVEAEDQLATKNALYSALLTSKRGETPESICLRAISKLGQKINIEEEITLCPQTTEQSNDDPELFRRVQSEDETEHHQAQSEILEKYGKFVVMKAKKLYYKLPQKPGVSLDDLIQEGMLGVLESAERMDQSYDTNFLTFASHRVFWRMLRHYDNMRSTVRVPLHIRDKIRRVKGLNNGRLNQHMSALGINAIAGITDLKANLQVSRHKGVRTVGELLEVDLISDHMGSLDNGYSPREMGNSQSYVIDEAKELDNITDMNEPIPIDEMAIRRCLSQEFIHNAMAKLTEREKTILTLRFGLDDGIERTLGEIGEIMDLSKERVRQLEAEIFKTIRLKLNTYKNNPFQD